ncbi:MAG TPA: alpha/beta fold hydrolase [Thermoanaerobaculia bacterium]|jgi:pimeloyl-ACP methyl ester carboxylesterase
MTDHASRVTREVVLPPFRFWETRAGHGTPIVLLHGLGGSSDWFRFNVEVLAESHLVAAADLVGFGRTHARRPLVFEEIAALLSRWIESSFDEPVHLAGNSMGGHIAIHVAAKRPDLVRSLILIDSTGIPFAFDPRTHFEYGALPHRGMAFARVLMRDAFRAGPTTLALAFARLLRDDARPLLRELRMPVLLLWGENDPLVPVPYAQQMHELIPQSRLVILPNAGHVPMWESPTAFNGALLSFVNEVDALHRPPDDRGAFAWGLAGFHDGIAHREAGRARDVVLLHGLGMSSAYFVHFARALFARGHSPIAPDLPGFGASANARPMTSYEHGERLAQWADALEVKDAIWIGHSAGCAVVAHLAARRPDLVRRPIAIGPLWTRSRHPDLHYMPRIALDAFREPLRLWRYILPAYWRVGIARWLGTWEKQLDDTTAPPPEMMMIAGTRDPLVDRTAVRVIDVPGAHACLFSHPEEVAERVNLG